MSSERNRSYVSVSLFGKASAKYWRAEDGEQLVIVRFGSDVSVHLPYSQAVALRADLAESLDEFTPERSNKEVA
ncbi:hypothetical protein [Nocardia sp. CS682]|uniref:hypothetical protein n=1 Tax=Nocardia sp. CS682 TaxID=1047172 RepID=UPI0010756152|nr:hypothetical protein [Nocardia sp. CS682]QBS43575.1 hypothetical protein DMB37_29190 [Nocardia sp. CS682]